MNKPVKQASRFDGHGGEGYERLRGRIPFGWIAGGLILAFANFAVDCPKGFEKKIATTLGASVDQGVCHARSYVRSFFP